MWIQAINQRFYYGWVIVAAIMVQLTFVTGLSFYNHSIILNALAAQSTFSVESASLAVSLFFLSGGLAGLGIAKLLSRFDVRSCITLGALISGFALLMLAFVHSAWQLYAVYILFGVGFSASALLPATTLLNRWFHSKRALALSMASTGLSLGGVLVTPLSALLVGKLGLANAVPWLGALFVVGVIPITWIFLRPSPESLGITSSPYLRYKINNQAVATNSELVENNQCDLEGVAFNQALRRRFFWCFSGAYIFLMMAQVGGIAHQYGLARQLLSEEQTALIVAIIPIASIVGRLIGGWIVELISMRAFAAVMMMVQTFALVLLAFGEGVLVLCVGLALFGSSVGNLLMLQPLLVSEAFGIKDYARIFALSNVMTSWGTALGPWIVGFVYGLSRDDYSMAYASIALAGFIGLLLFISGGKVRQAD